MGTAKVVDFTARVRRTRETLHDPGLSPDECAIIAGLQNRANLSVKEQSAILDIPKHRLRRAFVSIEEKGILAGRSPLISAFRLFNMAGNIYFRAPRLRHAKRSTMVEVLSGLPTGLYAAQVEGDYDFMVTYVGNSYAQVHSLLATIAAELETDFDRKAVSMSIRFDDFGRKHLAPPSIQPGVLHLSMSEPRVPVDETDVRILRALSDFEFHSHRKIAERLELHHTLVERRVAKLRANGVLHGMFYRFNLEPAGYQLHRLLITMPGFDLAGRERFRAFAARHPNIVRCVETLGQWDFELVVEAPRSQPIAQVEQALRTGFVGEIGSIQTLRIHQHLFYRGLPHSIKVTAG